MNRIFFTALLAILTGAVIHLQAQTPSTNAAPAKSTSIPDAISPTELINKMLQLAAAKGDDKNVGATYASALGLSAAGQVWPGRQVAIHGAPTGSLHGFVVSRGSDMDVLFFVKDKNKSRLLIFRAHRDGKAVMALICDIKTAKLTMQELDEAQKMLNGEIAFWANGVDELLSRK